MDQNLSKEQRSLRHAWAVHTSEFLDRYLVSDVEDPRINAQSILSRAFLVDSLFPGQFSDLIHEELRFSVCLNFILRVMKTRPSPFTSRRLLDALRQGQSRMEDFVLPNYLRDTWEHLSAGYRDLPHYLLIALEQPREPNGPFLPEGALSVFQNQWRQQLAPLLPSSHQVMTSAEAPRPSTPPSLPCLLEPACGSANDFRFLDTFGIAPFFRYAGLELNPTNLANARARFPHVSFYLGDVLTMPFQSQAFDCLFVHDLFEHLSLKAVEKALDEVCRVTRQHLCLSFFNMEDRSDHVEHPTQGYHWNLLSLQRILGLLAPKVAEAEVIHLPSFLDKKFGCRDYHNQQAYTIMASV